MEIDIVYRIPKEHSHKSAHIAHIQQNVQQGSSQSGPFFLRKEKENVWVDAICGQQSDKSPVDDHFLSIAVNGKESMVLQHLYQHSRTKGPQLSKRLQAHRGHLHHGNLQNIVLSRHSQIFLIHQQCG